MSKRRKGEGWFGAFARSTADASGRPITFLIASAVVLIWALSGPLFGFSDTWQLVINTSTTIVTFLMVFLIQSTQNRDGAAVQLKLDELIRATAAAHNALLDLEDLEPESLERVRAHYRALAKAARSEGASAKHSSAQHIDQVLRRHAGESGDQRRASGGDS